MRGELCSFGFEEGGVVLKPTALRFRNLHAGQNETGTPINPTFAIEGEHDGFPAYEIYINTKHPIFLHTDVLQWSPPLSADVFELVSDFDVSVSSAGNINQ